ncbi:M28 family peptidase [Dyella tabacisoli]|uniref:Aminopeptidase n=1 Tax=Dyella tabacisoli TaxID=2282381 RepID=A0A369UPB2_9GAMM|nr:M28 family peptidase [Dyella tabacisoli]RDD81558.1 aminopeptidase [Dyella tabacisoli]
MFRLLLTAAGCFVLAACQHHQAAAADSNPADTSQGFSPGIVVPDLARHIKVLASDEFEGRMPGSKGEQRTTDYLIQQFQRIGLEPGNNGSWLQTVPYIATTLQHAEQTKLDIDGSKTTSALNFGKDMVVGSPARQTHAQIKDSPLVFVGYGVDTPQRSDYAGLDLKGKTVVILVNDPGWKRQDPMLFKGRELTYYGHWTYKFDEAARHGAAAAFIVHDTDAAGYPWSVVQTGWQGAQFSRPAKEDMTPYLPIAGWLTSDAAQTLFAAAGADFSALKQRADQPDFKAIELDAKANLAIDSTIIQGESHNVIGKLRGSKQPDEAIVYSAHWDHLGRDGDRIYHGAVENASGIAGLLEIAEAFTHHKPKPHRSLLFLALTLEESGLLGSQQYIEQPAMPLEKTIADIDTDALTVIGPSRDIAVIGYGQSQLDDYLDEAAETQRREMAPDAKPVAGFFSHSEQFNFAKAGVPVLYARSGLDLVNGGIPAGRKAYDDYIASRYHQPSDAFDPNWDLRGMVQDLRALFIVGGKLSMETTYPQWKPGSDFKRPASTKR